MPDIYIDGLLSHGNSDQRALILTQRKFGLTAWKSVYLLIPTTQADLANYCSLHNVVRLSGTVLKLILSVFKA